MPADTGVTGSERRVRPVAHFTPGRGWINDPYGVHWDGRRYHMYYQALPGHTEWAPSCAWGHAVSGDLVVWEECDLALVPAAFERGCWSGCYVADGGDGGRAFYTRVGFGDPRLATIAVARRAASGGLISTADDVVVADPPYGVEVFRDPYVWRERDGWTMVVGGGTGDGDGVVSRYRSPDLERWDYRGAVRRGRVPGLGAGRRQVWECPQMMRVGGRWVLVVSVELAGTPGAVAACAGTDEAGRFAGGDWSRLIYGDAAYATSLFRDRDGRPCMMSWLREELRRLDGWSGAQSLVGALSTDDAGNVAVAPHPAVTTGHVFTHLSHAAGALRLDLSSRQPIHVTVADVASGDIEVCREGLCLARIAASRRGVELVIDRPGRPAEVMPGEPGVAMNLFVDADILEIFSARSYGAWRLMTAA